MDIPRPSSGRAVYRPDIDGLRAVAVLLVLFNHVGLSRFNGGFVGVDVFFVISGYLISGIILRDMAGEGFSFGRFYERRFRRIFPAMLVMLLVTSALAYLYLYPLEMGSFVETEVGALASVANIVLSHQSGYFAPIGRLRPLLHTWSLGVEEQFYVVFPLLLLAINRWGRRYLKPLLWVLTAVGFAVSCYWLGHNSSQAFFLSPFRAWEFLLGILLAARALPALNDAWKRNAASLSGIVLILAAGTRYQEWTPFPGWHALPPALGAMLVLWAGETGTSAVGQVLSWRPIRFIGVISYSLYLWHWPIQVFQTTDHILVPDHYPLQVVKAAVIIASIVVGALSWRFIEQPFRVGRLRGRLPLFAINGALIAVLLAFGLPLMQRDGWPGAGWPRTAAYTDFMQVFPTPEQTRWGSCYLDPSEFPQKFDRAACLADDPTRKHYLIIGDSHAAHIYWGLKNVFPEINFSMIAAAGCLPIYKELQVKEGMCDAFKDLIFHDYLAKHRVDVVVIEGRWSHEAVLTMQPTIDWLLQRGIKVVVIGTDVEFDGSLVRLLSISRREHDPNVLLRHRYPGPEEEDVEMKEVARDKWHVPYISIYDDLCNLETIAGQPSAGGCPVYGAPGIPLLWDSDHFGAAGSLLFARAVRARHQLLQ